MVSQELLELASERALQARLEMAVQGRGYRQVKVGLLCAGRVASAAVVDADRGADAVKSMRTGCLTKLFTSALVLRAVRRGEIELDEDVGQRLAPSCPAARVRLPGIKVAHLLEHAHGLDDSALRDTPFLEDGRIDVPLLIEKSTVTVPLARPGALYSYSHLGPLLLGAVLEQTYGRTWRALLQEELLGPLGIRHGLESTSPGATGRLRVCPSRGYDLAVPIETMLGFLEEYARAAIDQRVPMTKLPGWHSSEIGVRGGWKCYEGGWVGHNSEAPAPAAAVRVHPERHIAIVIDAGEQAPAPILAAMFGRVLPELVRIRIPSLLNASACAALATGDYVGRYESEAVSIAITRPNDAALELRAHHRRAGIVEQVPFIVTPLRAAQDDIFYPLPGAAYLAPFVQFIRDTGTAFGFLWNGKSVWRKSAVTC